MITYNTDASTFAPTSAIKECIGRAFELARTLLPEIPSEVSVEFEDRSENSGVGVSGYPRRAGVLVLAWDPGFRGKALQLASLEAEVLHQAFHWCQGYTYELPTAAPETALDVAIYEGAACVFARENGTTEPLWSDTTPLTAPTLQAWRDELQALPAALYAATPELWSHWAGPHADPDDSWKVHRVGTWIVDDYLKRTGTHVVELRHMAPADVLGTA